MTRLLPALLILGLTTGVVAAGHIANEDAMAAVGQGTERVGLRELVAGIEACQSASWPNDAGAAGHPCVHLAYIWSPSMPLSELGIEEARRAAGATGTALSLVPATELERPRSTPDTEPLRRSLLAAGATVHYPSLVVLRGDDAVGSAIVGYKRAEAYRALLPERLAAAIRGEVEAPAPAGTPETYPVAPGSPRQNIEVLWTHEISPPPGAFFRRVPGTSFISFDQRRRTYLRDLRSGRTFQGPGWVDFVPTPDGRLFVTPGRNARGLDFYLAAEVFEQGRSGGAEDVDPLVTDRRMQDQYPSVGILETDEDGRATRYRVLVSWFSGLALRDYDVRWDGSGISALTPAGPRMEGCPGEDLSTPMLSRNGRELAARDERTGTTKVFRMEDDGSCRELFDLGRQTSKVGFNDDGSLIAYSSPDPSSVRGGARSTTYVLDRTDMRTIRVPYSSSAGLVIPELVGADSLLIAVRESARSRSAEFRLLCCVR